MAKEGEAIELFDFPVQGFSFMGENLIRGTEPPAVDGHTHTFLRTNIGVLYAGGRQTGDPLADEMHKRDTVFLCSIEGCAAAFVTRPPYQGPEDEIVELKILVTPEDRQRFYSGEQLLSVL